MTISSRMATAEDQDETANILNGLAREFGKSTGDAEASDVTASARYCAFIMAIDFAARPGKV